MQLLIQECAQNQGWQEIQVPSASDPEVYYLVTVPPWDRTEDEAVCECYGYEYRGRCRHQREALSMICNWSSLDSEKQTADQEKRRICPECGGPTKVVLVSDG